MNKKVAKRIIKIPRGYYKKLNFNIEQPRIKKLGETQDKIHEKFGRAIKKLRESQGQDSPTFIQGVMGEQRLTLKDKIAEIIDKDLWGGMRKTHPKQCLDLADQILSLIRSKLPEEIDTYNADFDNGYKICLKEIKDLLI